MCIVEFDSQELDEPEHRSFEVPVGMFIKRPAKERQVGNADPATLLEEVNRELISELVEKTKLIKSLNHVSPLPLEGITLDKVLTTILSNVLNCFGYYRGIVYLWDKDRENLICYGTANLSPDSERIVRSRPLNIQRHDCIEIRAAQSSTYTFVEDPVSGPDLTHFDLKISRQHGGRGSVLYVPMRSKEETFGIMGVERFPAQAEQYPGQFRITDKDIESLMLFINHASIAIENARLYEQNRRKIEYLYKLQDIYHELNSLMDMDQLLEKILEGALEISGAEGGILWSCDIEKQTMSPSASRGFPKDLDPSLSVSSHAHPFCTVDAECNLMQLRDARNMCTHAPEGTFPECMLLLPIVSKEQLTAVLQLNGSERKIFDETEKEVLKIYTSQAGKLIENVQLYNRVLLEKRFTENVRKSIGVGILITNEQGCIRSINPKAMEIFSMHARSLLHQPVSHVFAGKRRFVSDVIGEVIHTPCGVEKELEFLSGHRHLVLKLNAFPVYDEEGILCGVTTFIQDVTEKKRLTESLNRMEKMAALGTMAAGVAHELRNPLSGIYAAVQTLSQELDLTEEQREEVAAVLDEVDRMESLIHEILQISKPMKLTFTRVDVNELLKKTIPASREELRTKRIRLSQRLDPHLPPIRADMDKLRQVFWNLFKNAVEASEPGGHIEIITEPEPFSPLDHTEFVQVHIVDYGVGIPRKTLPKIFDPFFTTKNEGTGLGLTICQRIVEEHQGRMQVSSEPGKGTKFTVRLKR